MWVDLTKGCFLLVLFLSFFFSVEVNFQKGGGKKSHVSTHLHLKVKLGRHIQGFQGQVRFKIKFYILRG